MMQKTFISIDLLYLNRRKLILINTYMKNNLVD